MAALREGNVHDVSTETITLRVDGDAVPAFHVRPDGVPVAGVVLHPDIGGPRPLFDDMARRLATHGFGVIVVDPFTAWSEEQCATIDARMASVSGLDDQQQVEVLEAAADRLIVSGVAPKPKKDGSDPRPANCWHAIVERAMAALPATPAPAGTSR